MIQLATYSPALMAVLVAGWPGTPEGAAAAAMARPGLSMKEHVAGEPGQITVTCKAEAAGLRGVACRALRTALVARARAERAHATLDVDIEWLRVETTFLLARLVWRVDGGAAQAGPEIEVSVNDPGCERGGRPASGRGAGQDNAAAVVTVNGRTGRRKTGDQDDVRALRDGRAGSGQASQRLRL